MTELEKLAGNFSQKVSSKTPRDEMIEDLKQLGIRIRVHYQLITCDDCPSKTDCEWAYDGYNTDGDCLAVK